jgi:hypothetical protein
MKFRNKKDKKEHWLDHSEDKYSAKLIKDTKLALNVLVMFIPLLLFWALFDQQVHSMRILTPDSDSEGSNVYVKTPNTPLVW